MQPTRTEALGPAQVRAATDLARVVQTCDGVAAFDEDAMLTLERPGRDRYLLTGPGTNDDDPPADDLIGFAQVSEGSAELAVHPDHRRRGLGRALVRAILADHPQVRLWAHGDLPGARAIARADGMVVARELWVMGRPAPRQEEAAAAVIPQGLRVRTFQEGADEDAWLAVNARAFADHPEQGRLDRTDLRSRMDQDWFDPATFWLAEDTATGDLLGSMWVKITDEAAGDDNGGGAPGENGSDAPGENNGTVRTGEIYVLGVDPAAQGRGVGSMLTSVAMDHFARIGLDRLVLYVEGDNTAAIRTYRRAGFDRDAIHVQYVARSASDHPGDATIEP